MAGACMEAGCGATVLARGWCSKHYQRWWKTTRIAPRRVVARNTANWAFTICQCGCGQRTGGYVSRYKSGHGQRSSLENRFWAKVSKTDDCWIWTGCLTVTGYGQIGLGGRLDGTDFAHRVAWRLANETEIPDGLLVCHHCDNPSCVRPSHLFLGTARDNSRDMVSKGRNKVYRGINHPSGKLNDDDVREIRRRVISGDSKTSIALEFAITPGYVYQLAQRKARAYVLDKPLEA